MAIMEVPVDILIDILSRLPSKTIGKCKCVCKHWRLLLQDATFLEAFFDRAHKYDADKTHLIIETRFCPGNGAYEYQNFYSTNLKSCEILTDLARPLLSMARNVTVIGSCNGLLCLSNGTTMASIWNPTTTELVKLPKLPFRDDDLLWQYGATRVIMGFGCEGNMQKYKVLRLIMDFGIEYGPYEAHIFTLGTNSWREITNNVPTGSLKTISTFLQKMVHLNGSLYWAVSQGRGSLLSKILAFDIKNEEFLDIPIPDPVLCTRTDFCLGVLQGSLCINVVNQDNLDVWMMKDYGVKSSWTKQFSLNTRFSLTDIWMITEEQFFMRQHSRADKLPWGTRALHMDMNGVFVFETDNFLMPLVIYNPISKRFTIHNDYRGKYHMESLVTYVESPISVASFAARDEKEHAATITKSHLSPDSSVASNIAIVLLGFLGTFKTCLLSTSLSW